MGYGFNLKHNHMIVGKAGIESNEKWQVNLLRNKVLMTGNASVVEQFYKHWLGEFEDVYEKRAMYNAFWYNVQADNARVFFGLIKMINDAFVRMITGGGVEFKVRESGKEYSGEVDYDEELTKRLRDILDFNEFEDKKWAMAESYQSGVGFAPIKISVDEDISPHPIVEVTRPERVEVFERRGITYGYMFKKQYEVDNNTFEVREIIEKVDQKPHVRYEVWITSTQNPQQIPIGSLNADTFQALELQHLVNEDGEAFDDVFEDLSDLPVILKNNTGNNPAFPQSPFGEADTQGLHTIEDALSELMSGMVEEVRKGKIKVLISEDLVPKDEHGQAGKFNDFNLSYEIMGKDETENKNLIQIVQGDINSDKYINAIGQFISYGCNIANIHPITVGITGVESIDASQESQVEREKVSMRTREKKLQSWRRELKKLFKLLLETQDIIDSKQVGDYEIELSFGQFENPSRESIVNVLSEAVQGNVLSTLDAMKQYHGDEKSEDEVYMSYLRWKLESNVGLSQKEQAFYQEKTGEQLIVEDDAE